METNDRRGEGGGPETAPPDVAQKKDRSRKRGRKRDWGKAFLQAFRLVGVVAPAAESAGVTRHAVRQRCLRDPAFRKAYEEALEDSTERMETVAISRATRAESPSDLLLMFLLKSRRPERYRDNYRLEHTGPDGGTVTPILASPGAVVLLPKDSFAERAKEHVQSSTT